MSAQEVKQMRFLDGSLFQGILEKAAMPCFITIYHKMLQYRYVVRVTAPDEANHVDIPVADELDISDSLRALCEKVHTTAALLTPAGWKAQENQENKAMSSFQKAYGQQQAVQTTPFPQAQQGLGQTSGGSYGGMLGGLSGGLIP